MEPVLHFFGLCPDAWAHVDLSDVLMYVLPQLRELARAVSLLITRVMRGVTV